MHSAIWSWPYNVMVLVVGGIVIYSLLHIGTDKEVDVSLLEDGKHFALRDQLGEGRYSATIYVKSPQKTVEINGVVNGLGLNQPGQVVEFESTDKDCLGVKFKMFYMQSFVRVIALESVLDTCRMYGFLKDGDSLLKVVR